MTLSLEASLKKLRTTYIDIFYVHWWDWTTSVEEVMDGLHHLVSQGRVLYLVRKPCQISYVLLSPDSILPRVLATHLHGLSQRQTSMHGIMERLSLLSIKGSGMFCIEM